MSLLSHPDDPNILFIIFNGFGYPKTKILNVLEELKSCEESRISNLTNVKNYLLICAICCLFVQAGLLALYMIKTDKYLNHLWNDLRVRAKLIYFDMRNVIEERLNETHNIEQIVEDIIDSETIKDSSVIKSRHSCKFLLRFSTVYLIAAAIFMVSSFYFFDEIILALLTRPSLLITLNQRRVETSEIFFNVLEYEQRLTNNSFVHIYRKFDPFRDPSIKIDELFDTISVGRKKLFSEKFKNIMTDKLKILLFEKAQNYNNFMKYGTVRGLSELLRYYYYVINNDLNDPYLEIETLYNMTSEFNLLTTTTSDLASKGSRDIVELKLNRMLYFTSFTYMILVFLYLFYLLPFINQEIVYVEKVIKAIIELNYIKIKLLCLKIIFQVYKSKIYL